MAGNLFPTRKSRQRAAWDESKRDRSRNTFGYPADAARFIHRSCLLEGELFTVKVYLLAVAVTAAQPEETMLGPEDMIIQYTKIALEYAFAWSVDYYWYAWATLLFSGCLLSLAPWRLPAEHDFFQMAAHTIRKSIFWGGVILLVCFAMCWWFYWLVAEFEVPDYNKVFFGYYLKTGKAHIMLLLAAPFTGLFLRFYYFRFFHPYISGLMRDWRNLQSTDEISDIRDERLKYVAKDFLPTKFYDSKKQKLVVGLDSSNDPIYIPLNVWRQTNTQIIGPTRYGKGVAIGCLMDQVIRFGDCLIYVDPKEDEWAPHVMYQAAKAAGKPFYYLTLHDKGIGYWSPFEGGTRRDAYARLVTIFGMVEAGGESDFYKIVEKMQLNRILGEHDSYDLTNLYGKITAFNSWQKNDRAKAIKVEALLENWRQIKSLNPPENVTRFSVEKALLEDAVVYIQGSLNDDVVKTATKALIMEIIQETMRLKSQRKKHATLVIDEMSFLVSKQVRDALATVVGFNMNIVSMYQSPNDLKFPDDKTLDGQALLQSMNVNSQIKLVYGGADYETAEWLSRLSGSITKTVTSMEKTNVRTMGAEEWERGRMIKAHEEATVPINVVLALPPRVAILIQPHQLATPTFTSPSKVNNTALLPAWLTEEGERIQNPIVATVVPEPPATKKLEHAQVESSSPTGPIYNMDDIIEEGLENTNRENLVWALGKKQKAILQSRISKEKFEAAQARLDKIKADEAPQNLEHAQESAKDLEHAQVSSSKTPPPAPLYNLEELLLKDKSELTDHQCIWLFKSKARATKAQALFTAEEAAKWKALGFKNANNKEAQTNEALADENNTEDDLDDFRAQQSDDRDDDPDSYTGRTKTQDDDMSMFEQ